MLNKQQRQRKESGNVLFLILIAVALFAALSYVVTQSTRSGGGSTEREKAILSSAQMTQYPTALRTAIIRMVLGGVAIENVKFNAPGAFGAYSTAQLVFHPSGGGATYQQAPADLSASGNAALTWTHNAQFDVPGIGIDGAGGNDVIAFLQGVSQSVCRQVNEELGITTTSCTLNGGVPQALPAVTTTNINTDMINAYAFPTADQADIQGAGGGCAAFTRQASGCFHDNTTPPGQYVFYSVLLER